MLYKLKKNPEPRSKKISSTESGSNDTILKPFPRSPVLKLGLKNSTESLTHAARFGDDFVHILKLCAINI